MSCLTFPTHNTAAFLNVITLGKAGTLLAFSFVEPQDFHDMHAQVSVLMSEFGVSVPQIPDFDFSRVEAEWHRLRSSIPEVWKFNNDGREFKVGEAMQARGLSAEYPVILIPGIVSTVRSTLLSFSSHPQVQTQQLGIGVMVNITRLSCILS